MSTTKAQEKWLVLGGKTGLLGQAITQALHAAGKESIATGKDDFVHTDSGDLAYHIDKIEPVGIINCVAYTHVDAAENDAQHALLVNKGIPAALGRLLQTRPIQLIHFSSDFVFDGNQMHPYTEEDTPNPLSVYGRSKLLGEQALQQAALTHCCIIRTSRLFGPGKTNFVNRVLTTCSFMDSLEVVHDQTGSPSYTLDVAQACLALMDKNATGLFHVSNFGTATWCELASETVQLANSHCRIDPIPSSKRAEKAKRPAYSALDSKLFSAVTGLTLRPWPQALREYIYLINPEDDDQ